MASGTVAPLARQRKLQLLLSLTHTKRMADRYDRLSGWLDPDT